MRILTGKFLKTTFCVWLIPALLMFAMIPEDAAGTILGEDLEKPKPVFTFEGDKIRAKLIPRAKSTSVLIYFKVSGGNLIAVEGMDFEEAANPSVDHKDFKSALFVVKIDKLSPGGAVKVSITSNFFSSSTQYWVFNRNLKEPWRDSKAKNLSHSDMVQELVVSVKDGGPFDSDGAVNGRIVLIGGPKDSFWGYALGTLFIRFFGIFLVLSVLMIGMILSGKVFKIIDKKKAKAEKGIKIQPVLAEKDIQPVEAVETEVGSELATAISVALHMHFSARKASATPYFSIPEVTPWVRQGRERAMNGRFFTLNRGNRLQNR